MSILATASTHLYSVATPIIVAAEKKKPKSGGFDPGVTPNSDGPWFGTIQSLSGSVVGTLILGSVVVLAIGIMIALIGRAVSSSGAQKVGIGGICLGLAGVILLGSISGLVFWLTGQSIV
ncbi:hypothetical protein [Rothia sp. P4278]|uniref:hypothetical protein n=1 Tax=Rothia sp. P4278 TaxID=3402658 RepID=UPI003AE3F632